MFDIELNGIPMVFETRPGLFAPGGLDRGTRAMLSCVSFSPADKVLDLGCGYGVVGIYAAKRLGAQAVTMVDIDATALVLARQNAHLNGLADMHMIQSNGFEGVADKDFTLILSNPPYHVDFSVPKHFIEAGFRHLALGGKLYMVTKRRGWYKNKLISVFGGVSIHDIDGYHVFVAEKRRANNALKRKTN